MNKSWFYVILTCLFELAWVYGFHEARNWWQWTIVILIILSDYHILPKACAHLPTGTVYAIFSGVGTIGTALMDVVLFGASFSLGKCFFIAIIIVGVVGLNLADNRHKKQTIKEAA